MVQLRKSRKSFRKTRGRKTRQRKNEKRKSRKTRSTRKIGGLGEEKIANNVYELASKIGELVKIEHDKKERERKKEEQKQKKEEQKQKKEEQKQKKEEQKQKKEEQKQKKEVEEVEEEVEEVEEEEKQKEEEILAMFQWLTGDKSGITCTFNRIALNYGTCHRKKMIYYYIAIHLFMCFEKFILKKRERETTIYNNLIAKFKKHKDRYRFSFGMIWRGKKEKKKFISGIGEKEEEFISGIGEKLYNSILEKEEKGEKEEKEYGKKLVQKIREGEGWRERLWMAMEKERQRKAAELEEEERQRKASELEEEERQRKAAELEEEEREKERDILETSSELVHFIAQLKNEKIIRKRMIQHVWYGKK